MMNTTMRAFNTSQWEVNIIMKSFGNKSYSVEKQDDGGNSGGYPCLHPMAQCALLDLG
jgi:hypothetical protein